MNLRDALKRFQAEESIDSIFVLRDEKNCSVLLAWKYLKPVSEYDAEVGAGDWEVLWETVNIDYKELSKMADLSEGQCRVIVDRLRHFRLIYPDGSISDPAHKYLRARTQKQLSELKR